MTISYLSSATAWSLIEKQWSLGLKNTHHIVQYNVQAGDRLTCLAMEDNSLVMNHMNWGFKPRENQSLELLNARSETIFSQSSFRFSIRSHRCVIPIDSFYVVKKHPLDGLSAFRVKSSNSDSLMIAGVMSEDRSTCAILTKTAQGSIQDVVSRQPIFIDENKELLTWLLTSNMKDVDELMNKSYLTDSTYHAITNDLVANINSPILHQAQYKDLTLFG